MARIHLHGALAEYAPAPLQLRVRTPAEAVRALLANFPGIGAAIRAGTWHVVRGAPDVDGMYLDKDELAIGLGPNTELHFLPAVEGSRGAGKAIIGAVIMVVAVVAAFWTGGASLTALSGTATVGGVSLGASYGTIAMFGASMMLSGISQMMAPTAKMQSLEAADQQKSYMFGGPTNRNEQGGVVPAIYGEVRAGSICVAGSISVDDVAVTSTTVTGVNAQPVVTPEGAAIETRLAADGVTYLADPVVFAVSSKLGDCAGYNFSAVTGGSIGVFVGGDVAVTLNEIGTTLEAAALSVRYVPTLSDVAVTRTTSNEGGGETTTTIQQAFLGGGFTVQAVNAAGAGIGQPRTVSISGHAPQGGWGDNGAGGDPSGPQGPGEGGDPGPSGGPD